MLNSIDQLGDLGEKGPAIALNEFFRISLRNGRSMCDAFVPVVGFLLVAALGFRVYRLQGSGYKAAHEHNSPNERSPERQVERGGWVGSRSQGPGIAADDSGFEVLRGIANPDLLRQQMNFELVVIPCFVGTAE